MRAVILAAGRGRRMLDQTNEIPKCLIEVRGKSLLDWQLGALYDSGITTVGIVTGYKREMLADRGLVEFNNPLWESTNMVTSLVSADEWLRGEPCIVSYSDIFYEATAVQELIQCSAALAITYDPHWLTLWRARFDDPLKDAETFRLDEDHCLAEIGNSPRSVDEIQGQYMGLLRIDPSGWSALKCVYEGLQAFEQNDLHLTQLLQRVVEGGSVRVQAIPYTASWGEVDSPQDLSVYD